MELLLGWSEYIIVEYTKHTAGLGCYVYYKHPLHQKVSSFLPNPSSSSLHDRIRKNRIRGTMSFLGLTVFEGRYYSPSFCRYILATKDTYLLPFLRARRLWSSFSASLPLCLPPFLPCFLLMLEIKPRVLCLSGKCSTVELYLQFLFFSHITQNCLKLTL